jgi:hypothetical protein
MEYVKPRNYFEHVRIARFFFGGGVAVKEAEEYMFAFIFSKYCRNVVSEY